MVFSRKKGESMVLGGDIILTVIEIKGDKVRLGVELPQDGTVHRQEVYEALRRAAQAHHNKSLRDRRESGLQPVGAQHGMVQEEEGTAAPKDRPLRR